MSKCKKYLRVYINGKKLRSTGSHSDDFNRILNYYFLRSSKLNDIDSVYNEILTLVKNKCKSIMDSVACIDIELVQKMYENKEECILDVIHVPYKFIKLDAIDRPINEVNSNCWICLFDSDYWKNTRSYDDIKKITEFPYFYKQQYYSERNLPMVSCVSNVITCENYSKHYKLYYTTPEGLCVPLSKLYDDYYDIEGLDHSWEPKSLVEFALRHNIKIGLVAYKTICMMYASYCYNEFISDDDLPLYNDFINVVVPDFGENHKAFTPSEIFYYESNPRWRYWKNNYETDTI